MLDLGLSELIVILAVALIVLGPKKLPELARNLGRGLAQFRRASEDLRRSILLGEETERLDNASKSPGHLSPLENQKESPNKTKSPDTYDTYSPMAIYMGISYQINFLINDNRKIYSRVNLYCVAIVGIIYCILKCPIYFF